MDCLGVLRVVATAIVVASCSVASAAEPDFDTDILPILTKSGCNAGACHGAAIGRGGFHLSLYGQDAQADWERIVRDFRGRRVNLVDPEMSLLLRKAGEFTDHGGGLALHGDDWNTVMEWIRHGAARKSAIDAPSLTAIRTEPARFLIDLASQPRASFRVVAELDDNSVRDMTSHAVITPLDPQSVVVEDDHGTVTALRPGRHVILVRVRDMTTAIEILVPLSPSNSHSRVADEGAGIIDAHVNHRLTELGVPAAPATEDLEFLRRVTLDLCGRIPTPGEVERFAAASSPDKRLRLVDQLLATPAATDHWTRWMLTSLRGTHGPPSGPTPVVAESYESWLRERVTDGTAVPEILARLISATGSPADNGAVGFYFSAADARAQTELFAEVVLGARIRCANCHDHPFAPWTQADYHGLAALFAGVRRGADVRWFAGATNVNPATGNPAVPRLPDGTTVAVATDPRPLLAEYVRGPGMRAVARAWVNRVWEAMFARGLVHPVDDIRLSNPATHPRLMEALIDDWQRHDFDLKYLLREMARSDAYGRVSTWNGGPESPAAATLAADFYACRTARPLPPAVLLGALDDVTSASHGLSPRRERGMVPNDSGASSPERCDAADDCLDDPQSLAGHLAVITGPLVNERVSDPSGFVNKIANDETLNHAQIIEKIYLRCLSRMPKDIERQFWESQLDSLPAVDARRERKWMIEDLVWSILTSRQFTMNH